MKKEKGITLIVLVITIIVLLILAGIVINLILGENGIINRAKTAREKYEQAMAREKLELVLVDLQVDKATKLEYNEKEYINNRLNENGMEVEGNIVIVNGWQFEIDRSVPEITKELERLTEEERLKPTIINIETTAGETQIQVSISLRNEEGATVIYTIREEGANEDLMSSEGISALEYTFNNLQKGKTYEITIKSINEYGTSTKTVSATTRVLVSNITLSESSIFMKPGENTELTYTVVPEEAMNNSLIWTSDNPSVATVENGKITAISEGITTIRVTSQDGSNISTSCEVTVSNKLFLYSYGNEFTSVTGGYTAYPQAGSPASSGETQSSGGGSVSFESDNINMRTRSGYYFGKNLSINKQIDFTSFTKLVLIYSVSEVYSSELRCSNI